MIYLDSMSYSNAPELEKIMVNGTSLGVRLSYHYEVDPFVLAGVDIDPKTGKAIPLNKPNKI